MIDQKIGYDELLWLFVSDDKMRPALTQPNEWGEKVYATDAHAMIGVPKYILKTEYPAHQKTPNIGFVLDQLVDHGPITYKDVEVFRCLEKFEKEYVKMDCDDCDSEGKCPHCHHVCDTCRGEGVVDNIDEPKIHTRSNGYVMVDGVYISPYYISLIERVLLATNSESFSIVKRNANALMFKIGEAEIVVMRMERGGDDGYPVQSINPIQ